MQTTTTLTTTTTSTTTATTTSGEHEFGLDLISETLHNLRENQGPRCSTEYQGSGFKGPQVMSGNPCVHLNTSKKLQNSHHLFYFFRQFQVTIWLYTLACIYSCLTLVITSSFLEETLKSKDSYFKFANLFKCDCLYTMVYVQTICTLCICVMGSILKKNF